MRDDRWLATISILVRSLRTAAAAVVVLSSLSGAQVVHGVVRDSTSRIPIRGAVITLLEQARSGLLSTVVAAEQSATMVRLAYRRKMDGDGSHAASMSVRIDSSPDAGVSFQASRPARDFARNGFVSSDGRDRTYFGPDPSVILDDAFIAAYCFRVMPPDRRRPEQVGLGFSAADHKRDRIDIDGALWIDTVARVLRDIEFRYVGFDRAVDALDPGGRVTFREMPTGIVLVDQWSLRLAGATVDTVRDIQFMPSIRTSVFVQESGGELGRVAWPDGRSWTASLGTVNLHASTHAGIAAPNVHLLLPDTPYEGVTDADGNATISSLVPGPYSLVIVDPRLSAIGLVLETPVRFDAMRGVAVDRVLEVPTAEDYVRRRCEEDHEQVAISAARFIVGRVTNADGVPLEGIRLNLQVETAPFQWHDLEKFYQTGTNGLFEFCPATLVGHPRVRVVARARDVPAVMASVDLHDRVTIVPLRITRTP